MKVVDAYAKRSGFYNIETMLEHINKNKPDENAIKTFIESRILVALAAIDDVLAEDKVFKSEVKLLNDN